MMLLLHHRIRHELPRERIVDFHSDLVRVAGEPGDDGGDGIHISIPGQEKRGRAALAKMGE